MALSTEQKIQLARSYGFRLQPRDAAVKPGVLGSLMLADFTPSGSAWAAVGDNQDALLDLAIEEHAMTLYMHGEWEHIFVEGKPARECRLLLDTVEQIVVCAQVREGDQWKTLNHEGRADLLDSMNDNDVWSNTDLSDEFEKTNERPHWA